MINQYKGDKRNIMDCMRLVEKLQKDLDTMAKRQATKPKKIEKKNQDSNKKRIVLALTIIGTAALVVGVAL